MSLGKVVVSALSSKAVGSNLSKGASFLTTRSRNLDPTNPDRFLVTSAGEFKGAVGSNLPKGASFLTTHSRTLDSTNPDRFLATSAGEFKGGLGVVQATLPYLCVPYGSSNTALPVLTLHTFTRVTQKE